MDAVGKLGLVGFQNNSTIYSTTPTLEKYCTYVRTKGTREEGRTSYALQAAPHTFEMEFRTGQISDDHQVQPRVLSGKIG